MTNSKDTPINCNNYIAMESRTIPYLVFIISVTVTEVCARNHRVTAFGIARCKLDGKFQPIPEVKIKLLDDDVVFDDTMATGRTRRSGRFYLSGQGRDAFNGKPDPKIQVEYAYSGPEGKFEIEKIVRNRKDESGTKPYSRVVNFGFLSFDNPHCRAYIRFYRVLKEYATFRIGKPPYSTLKVKSKAIIHGGTPFATTNVIRIPKSWDPISMSTARHEFAHTIRHSYDGRFSHFLRDVIRYRYAQHHNCNKKTNSGFAFNEGWAQYYAGDCRSELVE